MRRSPSEEIDSARSGRMALEPLVGAGPFERVVERVEQPFELVTADRVRRAHARCSVPERMPGSGRAGVCHCLARQRHAVWA